MCDPRRRQKQIAALEPERQGLGVGAVCEEGMLGKVEGLSCGMHQIPLTAVVT